jgi:hypothetical protein
MNSLGNLSPQLLQAMMQSALPKNYASNSSVAPQSPVFPRPPNMGSLTSMAYNMAGAPPVQRGYGGGGSPAINTPGAPPTRVPTPQTPQAGIQMPAPPMMGGMQLPPGLTPPMQLMQMLRGRYGY